MAIRVRQGDGVSCCALPRSGAVSWARRRALEAGIQGHGSGAALALQDGAEPLQLRGELVVLLRDAGGDPLIGHGSLSLSCRRL